MRTLYLTKDEQKRFQELPAKLREGWEIKEPEVICFEEANDLIMRLKVFVPKGFVFEELAKEASEAQTPGEIMRIASAIPVEKLSYNQMVDLFFVLGTKIIGGMILYALNTVESDDDIEGIAVLSVIRRAQFRANKSVCRCS